MVNSSSMLKAQRIIRAQGLTRRITIAAALKIVCEAGYHDTHEVEDIAVSLYRELAQRDVCITGGAPSEAVHKSLRADT
jgi:hypothetical protein